jgi:hypothetical protein
MAIAPAPLNFINSLLETAISTSSQEFKIKIKSEGNLL